MKFKYLFYLFFLTNSYSLQGQIENCNYYAKVSKSRFVKLVDSLVNYVDEKSDTSIVIGINSYNQSNIIILKQNLVEVEVKAYKIDSMMIPIDFNIDNKNGKILRNRILSVYALDSLVLLKPLLASADYGIFIQFCTFNYRKSYFVCSGQIQNSQNKEIISYFSKILELLNY